MPCSGRTERARPRCSTCWRPALSPARGAREAGLVENDLLNAFPLSFFLKERVNAACDHAVGVDTVQTSPTAGWSVAAVQRDEGMLRDGTDGPLRVESVRVVDRLLRFHTFRAGLRGCTNLRRERVRFLELPNRTFPITLTQGYRRAARPRHPSAVTLLSAFDPADRDR